MFVCTMMFVQFSSIVYASYICVLCTYMHAGDEEETNSSRCHVFFVLFFPGNKLKSGQYLTRTYNLSSRKMVYELAPPKFRMGVCVCTYVYGAVYVSPSNTHTQRIANTQIHVYTYYRHMVAACSIIL